MTILTLYLKQVRSIIKLNNTFITKYKKIKYKKFEIILKNNTILKKSPRCHNTENDNQKNKFVNMNKLQLKTFSLLRITGNL